MTVDGIVRLHVDGFLGRGEGASSADDVKKTDSGLAIGDFEINSSIAVVKYDTGIAGEESMSVKKSTCIR